MTYDPQDPTCRPLTAKQVEKLMKITSYGEQVVHRVWTENNGWRQIWVRLTDSFTYEGRHSVLGDSMKEVLEKLKYVCVRDAGDELEEGDKAV
jgi:hypothetical protein